MSSNPDATPASDGPATDGEQATIEEFNSVDQTNADETQQLSGSQFDAERFEDSQDDEEDKRIRAAIKEVFNAHNIVNIEPDEEYDNFADQKLIHQLLDYAGIDYMIDTFDGPIFGVNHRTHSPAPRRRFDIRADTGTNALAELEKLQHSDKMDILPKYATRMKRADDGGIEWFRIVDLEGFRDALENGLEKDESYQYKGITFEVFSYDKLRDRGLVTAELTFDENADPIFSGSDTPEDTEA